MVGAELIVLADASKKDFVQIAQGNYDIVHLATNIGSDSIEFKDGPLTYEQAATIFENERFGARLLVSQGCDYYELSQYIRRARVQWLLVIRPSVPRDVADFFFRHFYSLLNLGEEIPKAYRTSLLETDVEFGIKSAPWFILDKPQPRSETID